MSKLVFSPNISYLTPLVCLFLIACGGGGSDKVDDVNESITIPSGSEYTITSPVEKDYTGEVESPNAYVDVSWRNSPTCSSTPENVRQYAKTCKLKERGAFVVGNLSPQAVTVIIRLKPAD